MSHPYGQPPHQPGYPAPAPSYPGYPGPGHPAPHGSGFQPAPHGSGFQPGAHGSGFQPGQHGPGYQPAPSGGTGIAAGILALLGAVSCTISAVAMFILAAATSESSLTSGAVLATGARRRSGSRSSGSGSDVDVDVEFEGVGVLFGSVYILLALVLLIGGIMLLRRTSVGRITVIVGCAVSIVLTIIGTVGAAGGFLGIVGGVFFAILTLALAALGSTKRWIDAARMPAMPAVAGAAPYGY